MASGPKLEFVPARQQEAIRSEALRYKIIRPKPATSPKKAAKKGTTGLGPVFGKSSAPSEDSGSSVGEYDSEFEPFTDGKSSSANDSDSMEDSERSDTESEESEESEESDASEQSDDSSDGDDVSLDEAANKTDGAAAQQSDGDEPAGPVVSKQEFYDINELPNDRGQREPRRIYKSWHPAARAPVGLENRGVTCYQNAAVQALLHLPALGRYLLDVLKGEFPKVSSNSVTVELAQLFKKLMERKSAMFPSRLLRRLEDINPMLDEWQQEDSHEYYMSLLGRLQEDSVPRGEKLRSSIIHDIFGGSVEQKVTCQRCHTVSTTTQDFYDLPISFSASQSKGHYTLQKSVHDFFTPETIEPHRVSDQTGSATNNGGVTGGYQCERCKQLTRAIKHIAIAEAPEYLTVHIKRFKMDGQVSKKVKDVMEYPIEMNLTRYEKEDLAQAHPLHYKLVSVIVHEGRTVSSGHYIALTRQPNNDWMMYDDETVRRVPESFVQSHPSAYILIYSRLIPKSNPGPGARKNSPAPEPKKSKRGGPHPPRVNPSKPKSEKKAKSGKDKPTRGGPAAPSEKPVGKRKPVKPSREDSQTHAGKKSAKPDSKKLVVAKKLNAKKPRVASSSIDEIFEAKRRKTD